MDAQELDGSITELEERLDRLRALYEQYFCGIEKLEPQVPRKDLDRRIVLLRKEQIRNTAQRFKFNTIVQRYNTMQQHWNRILREIENGTYKRDLARAAARFGVDDALTAVGRKRAERFAAGLQAQLERQGRAKQGKSHGEEYEEVDDMDVESVDDDFDDDAPTPPPADATAEPGAAGESPRADHVAPGGVAGQPFQAHPQAQWAAHQSQPQELQGSAVWGQQGYQGYDPRQYQQHHQAYAQQHYQNQGYGQGYPQQPQHPYPYPQQPQGYPQHQGYPQGYPQQHSQPSHDYQQQYGQQHAHAQPAAPQQQEGWPEPARQPSSPPAGPSSQQSPRDKKAGGLRLGGGPSRKASAEALNRIASSLGTSEPPASKVRQPLDSDSGARKPLLSSPLGLDLPEPEPTVKPPEVVERMPSKPQLTPPPKTAATHANIAPTTKLTPPPRNPAADSTRSPAASEPKPLPKNLTPAPSSSPKPSAPPSPVAPSPKEERAPDARPAAEAAEAKRAQASALRPPGKREDLSDGRLREIYSQYVQSRRDQNESTAGITFEKLADSLRSQAEKLKTKHTSKRVDYEVVVKEGKTLIKPIVR